jgi:hypothetical protein
MTFEQFCDEAARIEIEPHRVRPAKEFSPDVRVPDNSVIVGCSSHIAAAIPAAALMLDNRGSDKRFGLSQPCPSVMRLVLEHSQELLNSWSRRDGQPITPNALLQEVTLIVEDASPDSTWALLLLLARIAGCELPSSLQPWLDAVELWEVHGLVDNPWTAWPALASALAHAHFPPNPGPSDYARAWTDTLRFAAGCVTRYTPQAIPNCHDWDLWRDANVALQREHQGYLDWLTRALTVQLSVPMRHADRRLLVDALIVDEELPAGSAKVFYRNDRENSLLHEGFSFAAQRRTGERAGDQGGVTIAIDTRRGIYLRRLWEKLEEMECAAWKSSGRERPHDHPRQLHLPNVEDHWNQPWYLDWRTESLIATPYGVVIGNDRLPGSMLKWEQVKQTIWEVYNPLQGVQVCTLGGELTPLLNLSPEAIPKKASKRLFLADWPRQPRLQGRAINVRWAMPRSLTG